MIDLRRFECLGGARCGPLDSRHHFSFGEYFDPDRMHWGNLRVWNDQTFAPGTGFPLHKHQDMEIITYVLEGAITHRDSLGNKERIAAGDIQVMSAGTGIACVGQNHEQVATKIFQIWIIPDQLGEGPSLATRPFPKAGCNGRFVTLASGRENDNGALPIRTDARVVGAALKAGETTQYPMSADRKGYLVPATGAVRIGNIRIGARDGAAIANVELLTVTAIEDSAIVLVDAA